MKLCKKCNMKTSFLIWIAGIISLTFSDPGIFRDLADDTLPAMHKALHLAAVYSIDGVTGLITSETNAFIKDMLHKVPLVPDRVENVCARLVSKRVAGKIGGEIEKLLREHVPHVVDEVVQQLTHELHKLDTGTDGLMAEFSKNMRKGLGNSKKLLK